MAEKKMERRQDQTVEKRYILRLFVAGEEVNSRMARKALDEICSQYLEGQCEVQIIDVLEDYRPAMQEKIIVTPALVVTGQFPRTVIFGNLSDRKKVMKALRIEETQ